jgi:hypothetical protein
VITAILKHGSKSDAQCCLVLLIVVCIVGRDKMETSILYFPPEV